MKRFWYGLKTFMLRLMPTNNYLYRLIWLGCISVAIPVILAGSAYYHFSMQKLTKQFQENHQASLQMLKDRLESSLTGIEHTSLQLSSNPAIRTAMDNPDYAADYLGQEDILEQFQLRKNTDNLIQEIVFYDQRSRVVLSHAYGHVKLEEYNQKQDIGSAMALEERAGWMYLPDSEPNGMLTYFRQLPVMTPGRTQGLLMIQVKEEALRGLLKSYSINGADQTVAVLDPHNRLLLRTASAGGEGASVEEASIRAALDSVRQQEDRSGRFILPSKGDDLLLAYHRTIYGRTYVSLMTEAEMIRHLDWIRGLIVFSVLIFILIGMLLTFFSSRLAYNPIQKLLSYGAVLRKNGAEEHPKGNELEYIRSCLSYLNEQAETLNQYVSNIQPDLRDRFLQRLLRSVPAGGRSSLSAECAKYQVPAEGRHYVALVIKVENLLKEKRFLPSEGSVIVFAVKNVMAELLERMPDLQGFVVDKDEREAVALIHFDEGVSPQEIRRALKQYGDEIRDAMLRYLNFTVSAGIGGTVPLERVSISYKDAQTALQIRLFHETEPVLFHEDLIRLERQPAFIYPREMEESIVELLWNGDVEQAEQVLFRFSKRVRTAESYNIIFQCYQVLLSTIIQSLESRGPGVLELLGDNLFDQLKLNQTSKEVHDWFAGVLFPLYLQVSHEIRTKSAKLIIQRVCSHIVNHADGTHSLAECAELVGVSPSYLSRLFKKETGTSFIEYVMEFKVEKAKQLLKNTDYSVTEIAEAVGYSERNLNRAFQRFVQMSPKQYRMSNR